ncbi:NHLP bacteriocin export ABC transporter permease/ATPase subunit [bacterium]|nr:NHLP bacteriocin export ABC transporter permease/ATPase subunit [bacterium]
MSTESHNDTGTNGEKRAPDIKSITRVKTSYFFRKKSRSAAYTGLHEVLDGKQPEGEFQAKPKQGLSDDGLLLKTCQLIGNREKINFVSGFSGASSAMDPLQKILRASNIRARKIVLSDLWWQNDLGILLGFLKEGNVPIALVRKGNQYRVENIRSGETYPVTAANCDQIESHGHSFFSPLPAGKLSAIDLVRFTLAFTKTDLLFFAILGLVSAILSLSIPLTAGYIFNVIIPGGQVTDLYQLGALLITVVLALGVINFTKAIAVLRFEGVASYKLQSAVWDRILSLKVPFFGKYDSGNLAERSLGIEKIRTVLSANVMGALVSLIFSIFYLALMIYYDLRLALLALLLGAVVAAFTLTISMLAYKHVAGYMRMEAIISGFMMMMIGGMQKVRMTSSGDKVFNIWAEKFSKQKEHYANKQKLIIIASIFTFGFPILASLLIYIRIFDLLTLPGGSFQIGDFIAFNSAYLSFQGALIAAFMVTVPVMSIKPTFDLLKPILDAEVEDYVSKKDPGELMGNIEIGNLKFRYPDSPELILKGISLKINAGEFVALVGGSGSGKSTLFRMLLGFEEYESGTILFDKIDLKELDIRIVRDQIGVVLQNGKIMQGSVLYNIVGTSTYTETDAWEAARMAGCDKDIEKMEQKMQTFLPAGGGTLSGGQQQRLVIARALIKKPKLLLFDEATSALDNDTQKTVTENVDQLQATRIVIAHRLSTIRGADKIIVLERGEIVEQGRYDELIDKKEWFYKLVKNQIN